MLTRRCQGMKRRTNCICTLGLLHLYESETASCKLQAIPGAGSNPTVFNQCKAPPQIPPCASLPRYWKAG